MHQPPSKGEMSTARFISLSQQGREAEQQPGHNPAAQSESTVEGRKFLREAARQAGQNGQAHIPNSPCALRNTKHVHQPWRSWGEVKMDLRGSHSQAQAMVLCVTKSRNFSLGRGCWLTSSYSCAFQPSQSSVPEQPCSWTLLLTCELWVLIQPLLYGDPSSPCHLKQPSWILVILQNGIDGLKNLWTLLGKPELYFSSELQWTSLLILHPEHQTHRQIGINLLGTSRKPQHKLSLNQ